MDAPVFSDSQSILKELQVNQSESRVTGFPSEILDDGASSNALKTQPITPQPSKDSQSSLPSTTSTTATAPVMH